MKRLRCIIVLLFVIGFIGCQPKVSFVEPQPVGVKDQTKFPKRLKGKYLSLSDSTILIISDNSMIREYDYYFKISIKDLDSNSRLSGDTLIDLITKDKTVMTRTGDTLSTLVHASDTIFKISPENILRKFKGYYFLNVCYGKNSWEVKRLNLSRGKLSIGQISEKSEIDNLAEITETPIDTVAPYKFSPTKRQFKEFIKKDGFGDREEFIRIK